jgi:hypothetical protein
MQNDNIWIKISSNEFKTKITLDQWKNIFIWLKDLDDDYNQFANDYHKNNLIKETIEIPKFIFLTTIIQFFCFYSSKIHIQHLNEIQYYLFALYCILAALYNDIDFLQQRYYLYQFIIYGNWLKSKYSDVDKIYKIQKDLLKYFNFDLFNITSTSYYLLNFEKFINNQLLEEERENFISNLFENELDNIYNNNIELILNNDPFILLNVIIERIFII